MSKIAQSRWPVLITFLLAGSAFAVPARWETIAVQAGSTVDIDKSRIVRLKDGKTAAWTRLTLDQPILDFEGQQRYTVVQALNHYDCANGSFSPQKRIYLLDDRVIKTEQAKSTHLVTTHSDSLDGRLLAEACKPRTVGEMQQTAARAAREVVAAAGSDRPRVMHAEMVGNAETQTPHGVKVADTQAPADKRRFIEMPVIDKSKIEDPYKGAAPPTPAVAQAVTPVPAPAAPPTAAPAKPVPEIPAARPAAKPEPSPTQDLSRQQRELMLATSGPRRAKAKPKVEEPDYSHVHWGYAGLGAPDNWSKIKPAYALCSSGTRQSPIDIRNGIKVDLEQLRFDYRSSSFRVLDNGHTVQVNVGEGSSISVMGRSYQLVQFHFHRPSEERINGKAFEMVIHLVHKDYDNNLAVVAVLIEKGPEHPMVQTLWNNLPLEVGQEMAPPNLTIDLAKFLPIRRDYYTYMGSLTTPPCTENVLWVVFKTPIQISPEQVAIFARLYPNNARPVQQVNDRLIKETR